MANPTGPSGEQFRAELDDGQIVETDGTTIIDPASGTQLPAVVLRMTRTRAHTLAHVLDDWCRTALVFTTLRSSEATERALAWTLDAGAAAAGDPKRGAAPCGSPKARPRTSASPPWVCSSSASGGSRPSSESP